MAERVDGALEPRKRLQSKTPKSEYNHKHRLVDASRGLASTHVCKCGELAKDWAMIHGRSGDNPEDYVALCRNCHKLYDGARKPYNRISS